MGVVTDENIAKNTACKCFIFGNPNNPEDRLCFSQGVVGALSDSQEISLCTDIETMETSKKFAERINRFETIGDLMDVCLESETKDFLGCVINQAQKLKNKMKSNPDSKNN
jgi:hypothetical protein